MDRATSFEKLINSSQNIVPKRLSFDFLNNSSTNDVFQSPKKRKFAEMNESDQSKANVSKTLDESLNSSTASSICASWETKLIRSDLIEAQSRIAQLKKEIQHQNTIQVELELKYEAKEKSLESEKNQFKNKATELERILKKNRKNESQLKEEIVKLKNAISISKQTNDQKLFDLRNENDSLKEMVNYKTNELNNRISESTRENTDLKAQLSNFEDELQSLRTLNSDLKNKLSEFSNLKTELEQEKNSHQNALLKIKDLEYEVNSYGDWKEVAKASHSRMSTMSEMEKEVQRLRQANKNLHESLGNKLLLEEQVHSLQTRLVRYEQSSLDQVALKSQIESLEKELKDWKKLGSDFVQKGAANNPINVRTYVENLLHRDLLLMSEKSSVSIEKTTIQNQLSEWRNQNEVATKQIETLEKSLKNYQSVIMKLQKKIKLVQSERDAQRQLLDSYEKDLTVTQGAQTGHAHETQYKLRIEMLTESVNGYKELCSKLEVENAELRGSCISSNPMDATVCTTEQYKTLRNDLEAIRSENEKLRKRKNELEIEIENLTLRSNVMNEERFKVVHFKNNPAAIAQQRAADELTKLKAENERLRIRNRKLEEGNEDLTARVNETMNVTLNIKELQKLREEHKTLEAKCQENEKLFSRINQELREVVYYLFGYKLDRYGNNNYRITSMYADNESDELLFQFNDNGTMDMLETDYSKMLSGFMNQYLHGPNGSLPAFTSALTIELVNRMTVTTVS